MCSVRAAAYTRHGGGNFDRGGDHDDNNDDNNYHGCYDRLGDDLV